MAENMMNSAKKATNEKYRDRYDQRFSKKASYSELLEANRREDARLSYHELLAKYGDKQLVLHIINNVHNP